MKCFEYKDANTGKTKVYTLEELTALLFKGTVANANNTAAASAQTNTPLVTGVTPVIPVITEGGVEVLKTGKVKKTAVVVKTPVQKIPSKKKTKNIKASSISDDVSKIYNELGDKTKSNNILINNVYQHAGVKYAKDVNGVFSLRVKNTNNHFGNPFSSVISELVKGDGLIPTDSTKESVEKYIEWILSETTDINPEQHKFIRTYLQSGALRNKPIVYYKELGEPSHATALDYLINKYDWTKAALGDTSASLAAKPVVEPTVISEDYGVVQVNTNPSPEFTNQILDIISDNVRKNAYVENGSGTANLMFSFGWQWKGNNSKKLAGRKLKVTPAEVDYNANGKRTRVNSKYFYDSKYNNGTDVPSIDKLDPLKRHIEKHLGIDLSNYDVALNNIYTEGTALYRHTDIDESNTAKGYPVVVYVLGNEHKVRIDDNKGKRLMGEMVNPKTMSLKNGDVYTFGMDGKGRFETVHDVIKADKSVSYPPITLPDGRVVTNYTVTFTFRRAADLEAGMPSTPAKLTTSTQSSTTEPAVDIKEGVSETPQAPSQEAPIPSVRPRPASNRGTSVRAGGKGSLYSKATTPVDVQREAAWLAEVLPGLPVEIRDRLITTPDGMKAEGYYHRAAIILSAAGNKGVAYHEALHAVLDLFIPQEQKDKILDSIHEDVLIAEERLAEMFRAYMINSDAIIGKYGYLGKLFMHIKDFVYGIMSPILGDHYTIFAKIRKGAYANTSMVPSISSPKYSKIPSPFKAAELRDITMALGYTAMTKHFYAPGVQNKEYREKVKGNLIEFADSLSAELRGESEDAYDAGDDALGDLRESQSLLWYDVASIMDTEGGYDMMGHVDSYLSAMKIEEGKIVSTVEDETTDAANNKTRSSMSTTFEFSTKAGARAEIKLALSMLHVSEMSEITGFNKFVSFSEVWSTVSKACIGIGNTSKRSAFEGMVDALSKASTIEGKEYLTQVIDKITKKDDMDFFRKMFVTTFSGTNNNLSITGFSKVPGSDKMKDIKYLAQNGDSSTVHISKWTSNFENNLDNDMDTGETRVSQAYEQQIRNASASFYTLYEDVQQRMADKKPINEDEIHKQISALMTSVGFNISPRAIGHIQRHLNKNYTNVIHLFSNQSLGCLLNPKGSKLQNKYTLMSLLSDNEGDPNPVITAETSPLVQLNKMLRSIAKTITQIEHTPGESYVLTAEGIKYTQGQDNLLSKTFAFMKSDPEGYVASMQGTDGDSRVDTQAIASSVFFKEFVSRATAITSKKIDQDFIDNLNVEVFNTLNVEGAESNLEYTDMEGLDETVTRVSRLLDPNPSLPGITFADKKTWYQYKGFTLSEVILNNNEDGSDMLSIHPNCKAVDAFVGYVKGEHHRVMEMDRYLQSIGGVLPAEEDIEFFNNNCTKFSLFSDLNWRPEYTQEMFYGKDSDITPRTLMFRALYNEAGDIRTIAYNNDTNKVFRDYIVYTLNNRMADTYAKFIEKDIFKALPIGVVNKNRSNILAAAQYTVFSQQTAIEFTKLFTGDPVFYKNLDDLKKRSVLTTATGVGNDTHDPESKFFTMATGKDEIINMKDYDPKGYAGLERATRNMYESIREEFNLSDEEIENRINDDLSPYTGCKVTDGFCWIKPERWQQIMDIHGKLDPRLDGIVENLKKGENIGYNEYLTGQPIKGMFGGFITRKIGPFYFRVPVYLKYSQAVLWPHIVKGNSKLEALEAKMDKAGVTEYVYNSGIKVGAIGAAGMNDDLVPVKLENNHYKIQQELGAKYAKEKGGSTGRGSQMDKILLLDINKEDGYAIDNGMISGQELIDYSNYLNSEISDVNTEAFINKLKVIKNEDGTYSYTDNKKELYEFLLDNVKEEATEDIKSALEARIHLDLLPQYRDKLYSVVTSALNKSNITVDTKGGSFIQMSSSGLGIIDKKALASTKGIIYLNNGAAPKGPRINADGTIESAQVLLPYRPAFELLLKKGLTPAQLKQELYESGMLDGLIGYRIPTQAQASIDKLEIIGILPKEMGDSVFVYSENPAKTGADFDIDKMYVLMSEYDIDSNNKLRRIPSTRQYQDALKKKIALLAKDLVKAMKYSDAEIHVDGDPETIKKAEAQIEDIKKQIAATKKEYLKSLKNAKLDVYNSILSNERMFPGLVQSLDNPALKRDAAIIVFLKTRYANLSDVEKEAYDSLNDREKIEFIEVQDSNRVEESLTFTQPFTQQEVKEGFGSGQVGIGIWANNSTSHSLFQQAGGIYAISSNFTTPELLNTVDIGDGLLGIDLCKKYDVKGFKISATITAFMNGSVDIAKGAYIFDVNCNQITSAPISFLIRAGVELKVINRIMSNKVVVDYCNAKSRKQSALAPEYRTAEHIALGRELSKFEKDQYKNESFFKTLSINKLDDMLINPSKDIAQMLQMFMELSDLSTDLSIVSNNFKYDVDGAGANLIENIVTEDSVNHVLDKTENRTLFGIERLLKGSLGTYRENASEFAQKLFGSECVTANDSAKFIYKTISKDLGHRTLNNTLVKKISKSLYAYALSGANSLAIDRAFIREYTNADNLNNLLDSLREHETNDAKDLVSNLLLADNGFTVITDVDFASRKAVSMIALATSKLDKYEKDDYISSFAELLNHQDPEVRDKAKVLVKIAFMTSGFGKGISSYYDKIPFATLMDAMPAVTSAAKSVNIDNFLDQFYRNNWHDDKIVPKLSRKYKIVRASIPGVINVTSESGNGMRPYMKSVAENGSTVLYKRIHESDAPIGTAAVYAVESRLGFNGKRVNVYQYNSINEKMDGGIYGDIARDVTGDTKYKRPKLSDDPNTMVKVAIVDADNRYFSLSGFENIPLKAKIESLKTISIVNALNESSVLIHEVEGVTGTTAFLDILPKAIDQINNMDLEHFQELLNNKCRI